MVQTPEEMNKDLPNCGSSAELLKARQNYPLQGKIHLTKQRIKEWYEHWDGQVYVSFSGGKDSTVLLHLVRELYPEVPAVFLDTGLEYPEIKSFVRTIDNVVWIRPSVTFNEVINKFGFPVVSKENAQKIYEIRNSNSDKLINKRLYGDQKGNGKLPEKWRFLIDAPFKISAHCCNSLKKYPVTKYEQESGRKPFIGTMTKDSRSRQTSYLRKGCNAFEYKRPISNPLSFWLESDIWEYIKKFKLKYSSIYDKGYKNTGCMFCMFGVHINKDENKFQLMKDTHPKQYNYCIEKLGCGKVLDYIGVDYE